MFVCLGYCCCIVVFVCTAVSCVLEVPPSNRSRLVRAKRGLYDMRCFCDVEPALVDVFFFLSTTSVRRKRRRREKEDDFICNTPQLLLVLCHGARCRENSSPVGKGFAMRLCIYTPLGVERCVFSLLLWLCARLHVRLFRRRSSEANRTLWPMARHPSYDRDKAKAREGVDVFLVRGARSLQMDGRGGGGVRRGQIGRRR